MTNISAPFFRTPNKCLKTLAGGDPNGVPESTRFQRLALSNLSPKAPSRREGTETDCLTYRRPHLFARRSPNQPK